MIALLAFLALPALGAGLGVDELRCEYRDSPKGIDCPDPRLSWILKSDQRGQRQSAYRIIVASGEDPLKRDKGDLWDTGQQPSDRTCQIVYSGRPLASGQRCFWKVKVWDKDGRPSAWSKPASWTMGLMKPSDWKAKWVGCDGLLDALKEKPTIPPVPYLRREFAIGKTVKRATLYASALGLYEMHINGKRVGSDYFTPGDCDFRKRTYYLTYDVTEMLKSGDNAIGAILGEGWYASYMAFSGKRNWYGGQPRLLAQIDIEFADGSKQTVGTDESWKARYGPIVEADMLMGCVYDARKEMPGWDTAGFNDRAWQAVTVDGGVKQSISAKPDEPVRVFEQIKPIKMTEPKPGAYTFDLGQNMVGWARLKLRGKPGRKITVRHAEMLNPDGTVYTTNLRAAKCIDTYYLKGRGEETLEPHFTFHGFRYVEITGLDAAPELDSVTGVVVHSDMPRTGNFACSSKLVNQLFHNIIWGQKGNYLEIPTDCPQRDERAGWTGDAQVFMPTAAFNFDVSSFFTKWLVDLITDGQRPDTTFPDVAPDLALGSGNAAWGDAAVICTHQMYKIYGDTRAVRQHFPALVKYMDWQLTNSADYVRGQGAYGDWLNLGGGVKSEVLGTAYFAYTARLMAELAVAIDRDDDALKYADLADRIKASFIRHFVSNDGSILESSQTGYALALTLDLLPEDVRPKTEQKLVDDIKGRDWHLASGFVGTPRLLQALHMGGRDDVAYKLLLQETFPSWLFQVKLGATTMWERWDGWTPDKGFQDPGMNSFNHYAFGAVGEYLYENVCGISAGAPGFKKITIRPVIGEGLDWAKCSYESIRGTISSSWKKTGVRLTLDVAIPPNTTAKVYVPAASPEMVTESGKPASGAEGVQFVKMDGRYAVFEVGGGKYKFAVNSAGVSSMGKSGREDLPQTKGNVVKPLLCISALVALALLAVPAVRKLIMRSMVGACFEG